MNGLEFVASLVSSLAWPAVVVIVVLLLRGPISSAVAKSGPLKRWKVGPGGAEAEFWDRTIEEVGESAADATRSASSLDGSTPVEAAELVRGQPLQIELAEEARVSPRAAVLEAFARVDREVRDLLAAALGDRSTVDRWPTRLVVEVAASRGVISDKTAEMIEGLIVLRNLAAHSPNSELSLDTEQALEYVSAADRVRRLVPMPMHFEELDATTRGWMLKRFEVEEASGHPYRSKTLSAAGLAAFPGLMRDAIQDPNGNEVSLTAALSRSDLWNPTETYERNGVARERKVNFGQASERLALTDFNTWYVAGLAHRLVDEGEEECQVYRAAEPKFEHASCTTHEGQRYPLAEIIDGHRAGYWPEPGDPTKLSIPAGPGCHHTIRRIG